MNTHHNPKLTSHHYNLHQYNQKCVCQICTCGKHHCPPTSTKFNAQTTHHHDFKPYQITSQKHQTTNYDLPQRHYDPETLKSSYNLHYQPYQIQPHLNPQKSLYIHKKLPFYDQTQYKKNYLPIKLQLERPATTRNYDYRNKAKFQGQTTYNREFSPKHIQRVSHTPLDYPRKKIPFEGQTVYNSEFKPHQIEVSKPTVCNCQYVPMRKNKFIGESRYHQEFKPYQIEKQCTCPINEMPALQRTCSPGKNHLNYSAQKNRWE